MGGWALNSFMTERFWKDLVLCLGNLNNFGAADAILSFVDFI
jgi:hypothetical protein